MRLYIIWSMMILALVFPAPGISTSLHKPPGGHQNTQAGNTKPSGIVPAAAPNTITGGDKAMTYTTRQLVASFPWGEGAGQLPYRRSDMGGLEDAAPSELLSLTEEIYFLRDPGSGALFKVNAASRITKAVDVAAALPAAWHSQIVYTYGMARTVGGGVAVVAGGRPAGGKRFEYALARFDASGRPLEGLPLADLASSGDTLVDLAVTPDGTIWVLGSAGAHLYSAKGKFLKVLEQVGGVMLPSGLFIANGRPPKLFDMEGNPRGEITLATKTQPDEFVAAGPDDLIISTVDPETLGDKWAGRIRAFYLWRLSVADRTMTLHDLITVPTLRMAEPAKGSLGDGMPVRSYFPQRGITFTDTGNIVMLELTDADCRFYGLARVPPNTGWVYKFTRPADLNATELKVLKAEYLTRLGLQKKEGEFWHLFQDMLWLGKRPEGLDPGSGTAKDPILRGLEVQNATR